MTALIRYTTALALAVAMAGYGASAALAQDIDDDFEDDFGDFDDDADEDFEDDFDDDLGDDDVADLDDADVDDEVDGEVPPLTLSAGSIQVDGVIEVNLSSNAVFEPFSIAPDLHYGVSDELTVGLIHSGVGSTGFFGGFGNGLCLTGEDAGCADVYNNAGVNARFSFMEGDVDLAADGGLYFTNFSDPLLMSLKAGVLGRWVSGDIQVLFNPNIFLGLTERDFNPDVLNVPVTALYTLSPEIAVGAQTGLSGQLDAFGDTWAVPLSLVASYMVNESLSVGGAFSFPRLLGELDTTDLRSINLVVSYRM